MEQTVAEIACTLDLSGRLPFARKTFNELHQAISFFRSSHFDQYIPTLGSESLDFESRLFDWLMNVTNDDDRALLFELASRIVFLTREDFSKLHQAALRGPICQWIVDQMGLQIDDPQLESKIQNELENHTWFTAITDSMQISEFHHANQLGGIDHRPDWRSLAEFGDPSKIQRYISNPRRPIHRIIILEDFVGSGTQMQMGTGSVSFAAQQFPKVPILLCPLIVCPEGASLSRQLAAAYPGLDFFPVLEITQDQLISPNSMFSSGSFEQAVLTLCSRLYNQVEGNRASAPRPYTPWGFHQTGAIVVFYTNTPANTLPLIQHASDMWNPLFPRSARIR